MIKPRPAKQFTAPNRAHRPCGSSRMAATPFCSSSILKIWKAPPEMHKRANTTCRTQMRMFIGLFSTLGWLPALKLRDLDQVSAGVVQAVDRGTGDLGWRHDEHGATRRDPLAVGPHVVAGQH